MSITEDVKLLLLTRYYLINIALSVRCIIWKENRSYDFVELILLGLLAYFVLFKKLSRFHIKWTTNLSDCFIYIKITNVLLGLYADDIGLIDGLYFVGIGISLFMSAPRYRIENGTVQFYYTAFPDLNTLKHDILRLIPAKWRV